LCAAQGGTANFDTVIGVWSGTCGALTALACNDDTCGFQSETTFGAVGGASYYISVAEFDAAVTGTFTLSVMNSGCPIPLPGNDECSGALPLTAGVNPAPSASGNVYQMTFATVSAGWGVPACATSIGADVWFTFAPANTGTYQISTENPGGFAHGSLTDTVLQVFPSTLCVPGAAIACDQDSGTDALSLVSVSLTAGQTYYVQVSDNGPVSGGSFYLNVEFTGGGPPANDNCTGTLPALVLGANPGSSLGATTSAGFATPCSTLVNDVWFTFTPPFSACYTINTENTSSPHGTMNDTVLAIYAACAVPALLCDDDSGTDTLSSITLSLTGGVTYRIQVGDLGTAPALQGTFWINIAQAPCVPGDDCSNAFPLVLGPNPAPAANGFTFTTSGATTSGGYPPLTSCGSPSLFEDLWLSFTPAASGAHTFHTNTPCGFTTAGSLTNTTIALYSSCTAGAPIACDADSGAASLSSVSAILTAGNTYFLRVGSTVAGTTGSFYVNVVQGGVAANDECSGAVPLVLGINPAPGASCNYFTNEGATNSAGWPALSACGILGINNDVWFEFTPSTTGPYLIDTNNPCGFTAGTATNTTVALYASCVPGGEIACDGDSGADNLSAVSAVLTAGTPYKIRVGTLFATIGTGTFYLSVNPGNGAPTNDTCGTAIPVFIGTNPSPAASCNTFFNDFATSDTTGLAPVCGNILHDVWFVFTPPVGGEYVIDTEAPPGFVIGTNTNSTVAIYSSCGATTPIACDANSGITGSGAMSIVNVANLVTGVPVFIRVGSTVSSLVGSFYLTITPKFSISFSSPFGPGSLQFDVAAGPPSGTYFLPVSVSAGLFPNGWLFGLDIPIFEVLNQLQFGFPFVGPLDSNGFSSFGPVVGLPSGVTLYGVGIGFTGASPGLPSVTSLPKSHTIP
jgi:hypothetical protein